MNKIHIILVALCAFVSQGVASREQTEHFPLIVPVSIDGVGHFLGLGYSGQHLISDGHLTALAFIGDVKGVSATLTNLSLGKKWLTLGGLVHKAQSTPLANYTRGSNNAPVTYRPNIDVLKLETSLSIGREHNIVYLDILAGTQTVVFDGFSNKAQDAIDLPEIHITDLEQTFIGSTLGLYYPFSSGKKNVNSYISAQANLKNQSKSAGYSGTHIASYNIEGQLLVFDNSFLFTQYFHSDANVTQKSDILSEQQVADTLTIDCSTSNTPTDCEQLNAGLASYISSHNQYGTAEALGGPERMKAYPLQYFRGAHSRYATIEMRFENLGSIDDKDFFLHLFTEAAQVADRTTELNDATILSSGFDFGLYVDTKFTYKLVAANGNNGWVGHLSLARYW